MIRGLFESADSAIFVNESDGVVIEDAMIAGPRGADVIVTNSTHFIIDNRSDVRLCGIIIGGKGLSGDILVLANRVIDGTRESTSKIFLGNLPRWSSVAPTTAAE